MNATAVAAPAQAGKAANADDALGPNTKATKTALSRDFAKQLETATKPVVKKPTIVLGDTQAPAQPVIAEPAATALAQIIATLVTAPVALPEAPAAPIAVAVTQKAAATVADAPEQTQAAIVQVLVAVKTEAAPEPPLTPLEQAVHDMLTELSDHKEAPNPDVAMAQALQLAPATSTSIAPPPTEPKQAAPVAPQQPEELVSQNHAHLVFDDPNGRIVMTVAIRGTEVNVSMRASDDSTAAALARNAGSLEEAMRGRGLQLAQFDAQRDLPREQREKPMYEKSTVKKSDGERFTLEENP
ncbi:MAG TPA: flagellar hook-length control protein FliK [Kofleriaceae bacterium]